MSNSGPMSSGLAYHVNTRGASQISNYCGVVDLLCTMLYHQLPAVSVSDRKVSASEMPVAESIEVFDISLNTTGVNLATASPV